MEQLPPESNLSLPLGSLLMAAWRNQDLGNPEVIDRIDKLILAQRTEPESSKV